MKPPLKESTRFVGYIEDADGCLVAMPLPSEAAEIVRAVNGYATTLTFVRMIANMPCLFPHGTGCEPCAAQRVLRELGEPVGSET